MAKDGAEGVVPNGTTSKLWLAICSLATCLLLSSLGISIANVALPSIARDFAASFQGVQWVIIAYLLTTTVIVVSVGRLGDVIGHCTVLRYGIALFTLGAVLCGIAPTLWSLIGARAVQGLGGAILMAQAVAMVRDTVPKEWTGSAMGLLATTSAIGTVLGPSFGGLLLAGSGWRAIFLIMIPLGVLNFILVLRYLPAKKPMEGTDRRNFDGQGVLILGLALAAYALSMTVGKGQFGPLNIILLITAASGFGLFLKVESKAAFPLIELDIFGNAVIRAGLIMNALVATVMMTTLIVGPFFLAQALGLDDVFVGMVMSIGPIISIISGVPSSGLVGRFGGSLVLIIGLSVMAAGFLTLSFLPGIIGVAGYIVAILVLTPGYQLFQAANNAAIMANVNHDQRGDVSGLEGLSRNLGLVTGAAMMGAVFAFASQASDITTAAPEAVATGMKVTFALAGALMFIALVAAVRRKAP